MAVRITVLDQLEVLFVFAIIEVRRATFVLALCIQIDLLSDHTSVVNAASTECIFFLDSLNQLSDFSHFAQNLDFLGEDKLHVGC
jgi:hypothetical protein